MRRAIVVLAVFIFLALAVGGLSLVETSRERGEVAVLTGQLASQAQTVEATQRSAASAEAKVADLSAQIDPASVTNDRALAGVVAEVSKSVSAVSDRVSALEQQRQKQINPLPAADIQSLRSDLDSIDMKVATLCKAVTGSSFC
jgi:phage shock protein A